MNRKKVTIAALLLTMLSLTLTCSAVAESTLEETRTVYHLEPPYGGLTVDIKAPYQADLGDEINVTVEVGATEVINVNYLSLSIYGLKNETDEISLRSVRITYLEGQYDRDETREYVCSITLPGEGDISPGLTYGTITCEWTVVGGILTLKLPSVGFVVTYVRNREFEQLKMAYEESNASYWELNSSYTELEEKYSASSGEIAGTRNLMYAFIATTVISAATAIFLLIRRPKTTWE